jgi:hypothetical protein
VLAQAMFGRPLVEPAGQRREGAALLLGETVATAALLLVVCALVRSGRGRLVPAAVGLWIGAACWATSSGSFANPAVTAARALTDSYTGIAPASVPGFVLAQCLGGAVGTALAALLFAPGAPGAPGAASVPAAVPRPRAGGEPVGPVGPVGLSELVGPVGSSGPVGPSVAAGAAE